jgi:hypothetical protein
MARLSVGHRVMITFAIVLAILFALAVYGYMTGAWKVEAAPQPAYEITKFEPRLLELEREAIENAFRQKITALWTVWMSDDAGQPARAVNGAVQARKAYIASMQRIEQREEEQKRR